MIFAKLSDIYGRRLSFFVALLIFVVFSAASGAAQTLNQLIIVRAFQGVGAAGCYAVPMAMCLELVRPEKYAAIASFMSIVFCCSLIGGNVIGGAVTRNTTWRWVFLLNCELTEGRT